ncbi:TPA: hypothetical protein RPW15_001902 [Campylobacter fetus subsp. venerealis]|uniref:Uncharacterized protein n=1 Tax=Campylobacter fetus subsp. venerealis NCTC 10354 TaxID=983328 RepID=A0AAE6MAI2_CAMFE|nr:MULTISPECIES: hypothetical protein [Campylobacter]OCS21816.1 hypothetical protein CFVI97532_07620 [Campylobacter fetus subsp. venerealis cfvi97/532]OCS25371.1 hypothetical protein CFVB10_08815 [Campylobacter fetus subsp. venerealis cfvB10]OCS29299.1 hypothetical protein CFVCCUG33900_07375 [Campylobacter fetus subsp. venerealis LMG 6570 = CCUG 33900]OCS42017.1 hypothetical protein CFVI02298_06320 [Campylobacter fetus subsp. venerealis cfvi02/298]AHE95046.1 hypothetical protein CFVI03293_1784
MDRRYNIFQRAYETMTELSNTPLPFEQISNMSDREIMFLKKTIEMMANYLDSIGFEFKGLSQEILTFIDEEIEQRGQSNSLLN